MDLTKELEFHFELARKSGRLPKWQTTANKFKLSKEDVISARNQWKVKHGERVRSVVEAEEEGDEEEKKPLPKLHTILDWLVDGGALALAIIIDLILNIVVFVTIAPDTLTKIGMAGLALLVVLFGLRGWLKGGVFGKSLWLLFALVATFSDLSFALYVTAVQSNNAVDTEFVRLTDEATKAGKYLESLQSLQLQKGEGYAQQVKDAREALGKANLAVSSYSKSDRSSGLTAAGVFSSIPDSIKAGRWIEFAFFSLIFIGLQLTIVSSATVVKNQDAIQ